MHIKRSRDNSSSRGDTLVEVLFATATAALLIIITLVLMNRNLAQIQMSVETTFVRQAIDSQAEVLRYMRDQYMDDKGAEFSDPPANTKPTVAKLWKDLVDADRPGNRTQLSATDFGVCQPDATGVVNPPASGNKAFYINTAASGEAEGDAVNIKDIKQYDAGSNLLKDISGASVSQTYARPGQGIWIESVNPDFGDRSNRYVDFHIRACWDPPFIGEKATLGTIVRLYYETPTGGEPTGFLPACSNGINDDADGLVDAADPGCHTDLNVGNPASYDAGDNDESNPPPLPPGFSWTTTGNTYNPCAASEAVVGDGFDGCFTSASSMYAWRNVKAEYDLSGVRSGVATLEIEYGQWGGAAPAGYFYSINVSTDSSPVTNYALPSGPAGVQKTYITTMGIPLDDPAKLTLEWLNNAGSDPNLQIYNIWLCRPANYLGRCSPPVASDPLPSGVDG